MNFWEDRLEAYRTFWRESTKPGSFNGMMLFILVPVQVTIFIMDVFDWVFKKELRR